MNRHMPIFTVKLIIQMNRSVSNVQENRSHSKSHSKSTSRSYMGIKLYNFSEIESYGKIRGPVFTQIKRQNIKAKLDLEKIAQLRVKDRLQRNQLYLGYQNNPFLVNQQHAKSQMNISSDTIIGDQTGRRSRRNLIDEFSKFKERDRKLSQQKHSKHLIKNQESACRLSNVIQKSVAHLGIPRNVAADVPQHRRSSMALKIQDKTIFSSNRMQFKDIVSMQQVSYFRKRGNNFNVFKILFEQQQKNILDKCYFDFSSLISSKNKIHLDKDLSRQARTIIRKVIEPKGHQIVQFDFSHLTFQDIISVAAGQLTPKAIYRNIYKLKGREKENSSIEDESEIIYKDASCNKLIQTKNEMQNANEINEYWKQKLQPKDQKYEKQIISRQQSINDQNNLQIQLLRKSIYDQNQHQQIKRRVLEQLNSFIDVDYQCPPNIQERNRLVRMRKQTRNKKEVIKVTKLLQTVQARQEQQKKINGIVGRRL